MELNEVVDTLRARFKTLVADVEALPWTFDNVMEAAPETES
jgi:hypothetical protein